MRRGRHQPDPAGNFEFGPLDIDQERRVSRFRESLDLMRKLWTEDNATHYGRFYNMDKVTVLPNPVQNPAFQSCSAAPPRAH